MLGYLMREIFFKELSNKITDIELTKSGFIINKPFGAKPQNIEWKQLRSIRFSDNDKVIIIKTVEKDIILNDNQIGWYEFIQSIPKIFKQFDFKKANSIMDSLKSCDVCGIIAVRDNICKICESEPWHQKSKKDKSEYLKDKQLEHFEYELKNKIKIKAFAEPQHGFKADENWKLHL
ncbi:hypothetical protein [uncultured Psychroserpens sp.]|uniref:hypothetical protein n=1 Tax=uncultured Psychroserpens sp. TaxID=255436 RepID=UPI00261CAA8B|nr:hypothetical protein [uncultured Psychroserpens sp.]